MLTPAFTVTLGTITCQLWWFWRNLLGQQTHSLTI